MIKKPVSVYINWSAYDELSDNVELTEALALRQLEQIIRWRSLGARLDYYLVDAFWYSRESGFREFRKPHWPDGPDRFLERCLANDVKPGLWLPTNNQGPHAQLEIHPAWANSWDPARRSFCLFSGGYLTDLLETMDDWYGRGVRAFKFDFANFNAVIPALERSMLPSEIRTANETALQAGLKNFREQHNDILLLGYNGFEEQETFSQTDLPLHRTINPRWLETFDSLYCGDPRPADIPAMNFWRSKDVYSDHMVRYFEAMGFPPERIDNAGFMIGTTGTCYYRGAAAWKGMLLLSLARGGWVNSYYGNLELLDGESVRWFSRAQSLFFHLQEKGHVMSFGALPGAGKGGYGFQFEDGRGAVAVVVNPLQRMDLVELPTHGEGRVLYCDAGYEPRLSGSEIELGPEQMAMVGFGVYAAAEYDLGVMDDVVIPNSISAIEAEWESVNSHLLRGWIRSAPLGILRIILSQKHLDGRACRSTGGAPPHGTTLGQILGIWVSQAGRPLPVRIQYDKAIWSGLSWAVGEVDVPEDGAEIEIVCKTTESDPVVLQAKVYRVVYGR